MRPDGFISGVEGVGMTEDDNSMVQETTVEVDC